MSDDTSIENLKLVRDHAWNWFSHHAEQRMTALRFFLLVIGIFAVAYYQTLNNHYYALASAFSVLALCFACLFWRLDLRTRELIRVGEDLLSQAEVRLTLLSGLKVDIIREVDTKLSKHATQFMPKTLYSYGQIFSTIFLLTIIFSLGAATYAINQTGLIQIIKQKFCSA